MKKTSLRLVSGLLSVLLMTGVLAACNKTDQPAQKTEDTGKKTDQKTEQKAEDKTETKASNTVVVGDPSDLDDNMLGGWTNPASNNNVRALIFGGGAMASTDLAGEVHVNPNFAKSIDVKEDADGNEVFTYVLNKDAKFSDGSPITVDDYLTSTLVFASNEMAKIDRYPIGGNEVVLGFTEWMKDNTKPWKGVRKLSDDSFSITILKEYIDHYLDDQKMISAAPKKVILPNVEIKDDGQGAYFARALTADDLKTISAKDGYRYNPQVVPGPYTIEKYDSAAKSITLKKNPNYPGDFEGRKPSIETIIVKYVANDQLVDQLKTGAIDVVSNQSGGSTIKQLLQAVEESQGKLTYTTSPRNGYGKIQFSCDFGPTKDEKVRQAIAHLLDRQTFAAQYTGGYGSIVDAAYGLGMPEYEENKAEIDNLNHYAFSVEEAKKLLDEAGWNKDKDGKPYQSGLRYKEVDGKLEPLVIKWLNTPSNPVSDLINTMLPSTMEQAGMKLEATTQDFKILIKNLYRQEIEKPEFHMFNLGTGFTNGRQNPWYTYSPEFMGTYNTTYLDDAKLYEATKKMRAARDNASWNKAWLEFQKEFNRALPELPLYSDLYHTVFNSKLKDFKINPYVDYGQALAVASLSDEASK